MASPASSSGSSSEPEHPLISAVTEFRVCVTLAQYLLPSEMYMLEQTTFWVHAETRWHLLQEPPVDSEPGTPVPAG